MIYVVHKKTLQCTPEDIFYHLINIAYDGSIKFNPVLIDGYDKHNLTISEEEYAHFKGKIFLEWWKNRFIAPQIGNFRDYYLQIVNKPYSGVCTNTGRCAFRWLYISPNGDVTHCCESDLRNNSYGNIRDRSLEDLYFHEERNKILSRHYILPKNDCSECILWGICHGGCSWAAKNSRNSFNSTFRCSSKKIFFFEYFIPTTGLKIDLKPQIF
jgi:radical SAM protein with 4Fe4S-binding SPASM domain